MKPCDTTLLLRRLYNAVLLIEADADGDGRTAGFAPLLREAIAALTPAGPEATPGSATAPANTRQVAGDHYKTMGVEPWDVIDTWPIEQRIGAYRAGVLKYVMRMGRKDERLQEIRKAFHYNEKLAEVLAEDAAQQQD